MNEIKEISSKSYITVICSEDANPQFDKLQLRTNPPSYIELQPGKNVLTIEQYPALKYGFSQVDDYELDFSSGTSYEYNGVGILEIDFSHFDASEVTSMDRMFSHIPNLRRISFSGVKNLAPTSIVSAFSMIDDNMDELDLTPIDMSKVEDASYLFSGCSIKKVNLSNLDFCALKSIDNMFSSCGIRELIFDGCKINNPENIYFELDTDDILTISLNGCDESVVESFTCSIMDYRRRFAFPQKQLFVVSSGISKCPNNQLTE